MSFFNFKKTAFSLFLFLCLWGSLTTKAHADFFPEPFSSPMYEYNPDEGIMAISDVQADNYQTVFFASDADDFLLENNGNNIFDNVINDPDAILGYAWSERVGWIAFSHGIIENSTKYYPYFSKDADNSQDILKGFLWNKYSGWIQLSSDNFETDNGQTDTNWGVVFNGDGFSGKAWGAALGWIDFSNVTYNGTTEKFGGYACSGNDCSEEENKIYFTKVPDGISANSGQLADWGVSRNMTEIQDTFPNEPNHAEIGGTVCDLLINDQCGGNSPTVALSVNNDGNEVTVNFDSRLTLSGNHDLKSKITNKYGQTFEYVNPKTSNDYLRIKVVTWPMNCSLDGGIFVCDVPNLNFSTNNNGAVADGEDPLTLTARLTNSAGDSIYVDPSNNVFDLSMTLVFEDTVETNQLDVTTSYNAVNYLDTINKTPYGSESSVNTLNLIDNNSNGEFKVDITSLAPTTGTNQLILKDFEITILLDSDAPTDSREFTFNKTTDYSSQEDINLTFSPALTATIDNFEHLIENTPSVFDVVLENHSPTKSLSQINLNTLFDGILANLIAEIKAKSSSSAYSDVLIDQLQLVSANFSASDYLMTAEDSDNQNVAGNTKILLDELSGNSTQSLTFDLKPLLVLGDQVDTSEEITFSTEVAYDIEDAGTTTFHKSHNLDLQNNLLTSQVDVKGMASGEKIYDINQDYSINTSGTMSLGEISEEIRKNVADLTRNETPGDLTSNYTIGSWDKNNLINAGKTLYYEGNGTLVIDGLAVDDNQGSIIVVGGDVYIKGNITYTGDQTGSFGLIILQDANGNGGDVYIDPSVTNLVGGYYVEGTMTSALDSDNNDSIGDDEIFDGFSDNKELLANQLFINGSLISKNTIGGSRQNPVEFPEGYDSSYCSGGTDDQKCAERFDLNYLRNFAVDSDGNILNGGIRATGTETLSNSAFLIKYDSRIQTNIPSGFEMKTEINFEEIVL